MEIKEKEVWKPVMEFNGIYEVSNYGRVRSVRMKYKNGKILKPSLNKIGKPQVNLYDFKNNKYYTRTIESLMLKEFFGFKVCNFRPSKNDRVEYRNGNIKDVNVWNVILPR